MKTLVQILKEITLSKIHRVLDSGSPVGTVSPERGEMSSEQKKAAHKAIQKVLRRHSDSGMISFTGPHGGRYKYSDDDAPSEEGSYIVRPGRHKKARQNFHRILKSVGRQFGQESVLKIRKKGPKQKPTGALHYTTGKDTGKVDRKGQITYNQPLAIGGGDTKLKGKESSFTVTK